MVSDDEPLLHLLSSLQALDYQFTTVTPTTHARVLNRRVTGPLSLRDIFGWNRPFEPDELDDGLLNHLQAADAVEQYHGRLRSKLRVASLDGTLFLHSSFPTEQPDSVFFGPDTYRFARFVREHLSIAAAPPRVIDMGAGAGAGGIIIARRSPSTKVTLVDSNRAALKLAAINAAHADVHVECVAADAVRYSAELLIANPPYMMDAARRAYRHGGGLLGGGVACDWVRQALQLMPADAMILLYTGAAYQRGEAPLIQALSDACRAAGAELAIHEIDPDVFGEELDCAAYADVDRIAVIGAVITTGGQTGRVVRTRHLSVERRS